MKFFRNIFGAESKPVTLVEKLQKLQELSANELDALVLGASGNSEDIELREALIGKASTSALMSMAASTSAASELVKKSRQQLAQLIDEGALASATLLNTIKDTEQLLTVAAFSSTDALQRQVLESVEDQALIFKLCANATSSKVRQLLAAKVEGEDALKDLAQTLKTKDKTAYKILKAKLDVIRSEQQRIQGIEAQANTLVEEIRYLANKDVDKETITRFERVQRRWGELTDVPQVFATQFSEERERCETNIEGYRAALAEEDAKQQEISESHDKRKTVLVSCWALVNRLYELENPDEGFDADIRRELEEQRSIWENLKDLSKPAQKQARDFTRMSEALETLLSEYSALGSLVEFRNKVANSQNEDERRADIAQLRKLLNVTSTLTQYTLNDSVKRTYELLEQVDADYAKQKENFEKLTRAVTGMLRRANQAVDEGRLKQAIGVRHSIDEKLESINDVPPFIAKKLEELDESIQKLVDWQAYAVVPKKESLVEAMEKLVGADLPPEALATKIKNLQKEWKALSQSGKDRQEALWEKFSELADQAYEPCKHFYDDLSAQRKENLEKRQALVKNLQDFFAQYNWDAADWKHVDQIVRGARKEFHSYAPVERVANKAVLTEFDTAFAKIQEKLDQEYAKNKAAKEILIEQAEKLAQMSDIDQAIEGIKRIQAQWKTIGRCQHKENEALWKAFRVHCDKIFDAKTEAQNAHRAAVDEVINHARSFITSIQALVEKNAEELLAARSDRDGLQADFAALQDVPEKVYRGIERDFTKGLDAFDKKVASYLREGESHAWQDFFSACEKINHYHNEVLSGADESAAALKEDVDNFVEQVNQWPEGGQNFVKQKLLQVASDPNANTEENLKALKLLCIRAEILADQETPESDKQLRMEYQVQLLQKGLGAQRLSDNASLSIAKEWCGVGPVSEEEYKALFERFYSSWQALA